MRQNGRTASAARLFTSVSNLDDALNTSNFHASGACIGCGKCERACLANAIRMQDGRPAWVKSTCFMCFGCLRLCPTAAIRYGGE